jgi:hypothetical protein
MLALFALSLAEFILEDGFPSKTGNSFDGFPSGISKLYETKTIGRINPKK